MSEFKSQTNKALLWELLNDQNIFNNIPDSELTNIQELFESEIEKIYNKTNNKSDLLILNKLLIQNFTESLNYYKENKKFKNHTIKSDYDEKIKEFSNDFVNKKPKEINFKDNEDEPLKIEDLDKKLDIIQKEREKLIPEYEKININNTNNTNYTNNTNNINNKDNDNDNDNLNNISEISEILEKRENIKINDKDELVNKDDLIIKDIDINDNFFNKLKKKEKTQEISQDIIENINNRLNNLENKIDEIINYIKNTK